MIAPRGNRPLPRPEALRAAGSPPFPEGSAAVRPTGFHIQYTIFPAEDMPHRTRSSPLWPIPSMRHIWLNFHVICLWRKSQP